MKIGIYLPGLGHSFASESVEKYTQRLMDEMSYDTNDVEYELKTEIITYSEKRESTVVSIIEKDNDKSIVRFKMYDFRYQEILTEKFNSYSIILKNIFLFLLVLRKSPIVLKRLIWPANFKKTGQTFYVLGIFIILALAVILLIPASLNLGSEILNSQDLTDKFVKEGSDYAERIKDFKEKYEVVVKPFWGKFLQPLIPILTILLLLVPNAKVMITSLATEFVCANDYLEHGAQKQLVQGHLEKLVDFISENDKDCKIQFHAYSFGTLVAIDFVYPYGNSSSANTENFVEGLITIGSPFEFVQSYYTGYYVNRRKTVGDKLKWLNVYSTDDMMGTNFRNDVKAGVAQFGIESNTTKPININYEISPIKKNGPISFLSLYHIKVHGMYWDPNPSGQSCIRLLYAEMKKQNLMV